MERLKPTEIIRSKTTIKILSVLLGIVLWFTVLNTINPRRTRQITVPVNFPGMGQLADRNLGIKNPDYKKELVLTLEGREEDVNILAERDFTAEADVTDILAEGSYQVQITLKKPENINYQLKSISPEQIRLDVEKIEERLIPVEIQLEGQPYNGYTVIEAAVYPEDIAISSLRSVMAGIGRVIVPVDITQLDRSFSARKSCRVLGVGGEEIMDYRDKFSVEVRINVAREVPVVPVITGQPGGDAYETTRQTSPARVLITGSAEAMAGVAEIMTYPIDITGLTSDGVFSAGLNVPEGITLYNSPYSVEVTVSVGVLQTVDLSVEGEVIAILGKDEEKFTYQVQTSSILVKCKGLEKDVTALTLEKLAPSVNADLLKAGIHRLGVEFQEVTGITVIGSYFVEVDVREIEPDPGETTPEPSPTPTPQGTPQ